jgi:hypothetical protein
MDSTSHISSVKLFYWLMSAMTLTEDERFHLANCSHCQSLVEEYKKYIRAA